MKKAVFLILMLIPVIGFSSEGDNRKAFHFGGWSYHFYERDLPKRKSINNETHNIKLIEWNRFYIGEFINSFGNKTYLASYFFYKHSLFNNDHLRLRVFGGLTHGYTKCYGHGSSSENVCPVVAPQVTYTKYKLEPSFTFFGNAGIVSFSISW